MNVSDWLVEHSEKLANSWERMFVEKVLSAVPDLDFISLEAQMPFIDNEGGRRFCDFAIIEGDGVRIGLEVDGYDKTGTGRGMSRQEFRDWQRRHASLESQGWRVLRFANADVRDRPDECAEYIELLLRHERENLDHKLQLEKTIKKLQKEANKNKKIQPALKQELEQTKRELELAKQSESLSPKESARLEKLSTERKLKIDQLEDNLEKALKEAEIMKHAIWAFAILISLVIITLIIQLNDSKSLIPSNVSEPQDSGSSEVAHKETGTAAQEKYLEPWKSCETGVDWRDIYDFFGKVVYVKGPVADKSFRSEVTGQPTYINIGEPFPSRDRVTLVIWGRDRNALQSVLNQIDVGDRICATGQVAEYGGIAQIQISNPGQIELP